MDETNLELGLPESFSLPLGGGLHEEQADWLLGDAYFSMGPSSFEDVDEAAAPPYYYEPPADPTLLPGENMPSVFGEPSDVFTDDVDPDGHPLMQEPIHQETDFVEPVPLQYEPPDASVAHGGSEGLSEAQAEEFFRAGPPPAIDVPMLDVGSELPIVPSSQQHEDYQLHQDVPSESRAFDEVQIITHGEAEDPDPVVLEQSQLPRKQVAMQLDTGRTQIPNNQMTRELGDASLLVRSLMGSLPSVSKRNRSATPRAHATPLWHRPGMASLLFVTPSIESLIARQVRAFMAGPVEVDDTSESGESRVSVTAGGTAHVDVEALPVPPMPPSEERFRSVQRRASSMIGFGVAPHGGEQDNFNAFDSIADPQGEMHDGVGPTEYDPAISFRPPRLPSFAGVPGPSGIPIVGEGMEETLGLDAHEVEGGALPLEFGYDDGLEHLDVGGASSDPRSSHMAMSGSDYATATSRAPTAAGSGSEESPKEGSPSALPSQPILIELMRAVRDAPAGHGVSLQRSLLQEKNRLQAARLLFNALVLASHGRIALEQTEPYGELILMQVKAV
eukprot:scaffold198855_cov29-Tisochrysis_lutea.AAC.1